MTKPVTWHPSAMAALERLSASGALFATTTEASAILNYDPRTVRAAIEAGEIPAIRAGSTWRIRVSWLREQVGLDDVPSETALNA
jgi:excisionase family DNA binding protein